MPSAPSRAAASLVPPTSNAAGSTRVRRLLARASRLPVRRHSGAALDVAGGVVRPDQEPHLRARREEAGVAGLEAADPVPGFGVADRAAVDPELAFDDPKDDLV